MSRQWEPDTLSVTFSSDFSQLPVSTGEIQLIWSYLDEVLAKALQQEEEE